MLLEHHHGLAHQHTVRVACRVREVAGDEHVAARQRFVLAGPGRGGAGLPARLAGAGAEGVEYLAVPLKLGQGGGPGFGGVEQNDDVVDTAVHGAALDPDDVAHGAAGIGHCDRHVDGRRGGGVVGLETAIGRRGSARRRRGGGGCDRRARIGQAEGAGRGSRRAVVQLEFGSDVALRVGRASQPTGIGGWRGCGAVAGRTDRHRRRADVGKNLGAGIHRAATRRIGHRELGGARAPGRRRNHIGAVGQPGDQTRELAVGARCESAADITAVDIDFQSRCLNAGRNHHFDQRIAAADKIGAVAERPDLQLRRPVVITAAAATGGQDSHSEKQCPSRATRGRFLGIPHTCLRFLARRSSVLLTEFDFSLGAGTCGAHTNRWFSTSERICFDCYVSSAD